MSLSPIVYIIACLSSSIESKYAFAKLCAVYLSDLSWSSQLFIANNIGHEKHIIEVRINEK
ncbi:MAG: hypothetical protein ACJ0PK_04025 [Flavobacteriaceae bacterium]